MRTALASADIAAAFEAACRDELQALKPGNVHIHSAGHGMDVATFHRAAHAASPFIADPALTVGQRIYRATKASFEATSLNANLGIVLLCAPLAKAAGEIDITTGLRRCLATILSSLDESDADDAFAAIRLANPAGLGKVDKGDVTYSNPRMTLLEAMGLAAERDRIARAYVTVYEDIFDVALPALEEAFALAATRDLATSTLHMKLLATFPDSHIARKWGPETAAEVQERAGDLSRYWSPAVTLKSLERLKEFDAQLKDKNLNPGTTADFVVATLFTHRLQQRKQP